MNKIDVDSSLLFNTIKYSIYEKLRLTQCTQVDCGTIDSQERYRQI